MHNLSTRHIVDHLSKNIEKQVSNQHIINNNYRNMRSNNATSHGERYHQQQTEKESLGTQQMSKTDYTRKGKWVSDEEFVDKFDKLITKVRD